MDGFSFPLVFGAGVLSFLSPCVLPLVPPYLTYMSGSSFDQLRADGATAGVIWQKSVFTSIFFILGFSLVFITFGATATAFGQAFRQALPIITPIAGLFIIAMGLHFLGIFRIGLLYREARVSIEKPLGLWGAYAMGLAFAFGWTPCIGPILSTVLALAANEASLGAGVRLLAVYSLGLGIPFVLAAVAIRPFLAFMQRFRRHLGLMEKIMGVVLVLTGVAFLNVLDWFSIQALGQWLIETFPGLARIEELMTPETLQQDLRNFTPGR